MLSKLGQGQNTAGPCEIGVRFGEAAQRLVRVRRPLRTSRPKKLVDLRLDAIPGKRGVRLVNPLLVASSKGDM